MTEIKFLKKYLEELESRESELCKILKNVDVNSKEYLEARCELSDIRVAIDKLVYDGEVYLVSSEDYKYENLL